MEIGTWDVPLEAEELSDFLERANHIRDMFTDDEIESLGAFWETQEQEKLSISRLPETLSEKCNVLMADFLKSKYAKTQSPPIGVRSVLDKIAPECCEHLCGNILEYFRHQKDVLMMFYSGETDKPFLEEVVAEIKADEYAFQDYLMQNGMTEEGFNHMIRELVNAETLPALIKVLKKYGRELMKLSFEYARCKFNHDTEESKDCDYITILDDVKDLQRHFPDIFDRVESLSKNLTDMLNLHLLFGFICNDEKDNVLSHLFFFVFVYALGYKDDWQRSFFGYVFGAMGESQKTGFVRFLNLPVEEGGSLYVEEFCDAMEQYCGENGIRPMIPLNLVKRRNKKELVRDNNTYDDTQYVRVLNCKLPRCFGKDKNEVDKMLYDKLKKLFDLLVKNGYIENSSSDLFIYRLSGLNRPDDNIVAKSVRCMNVKGLAYVLRGLCSSSKEKFPSSTLDKFFKTKKGNTPNFSSGTNVQVGDLKKLVNKKLSEAIKMLRECGFENVEDIHDGSR